MNGLHSYPCLLDLRWKSFQFRRRIDKTERGRVVLEVLVVLVIIQLGLLLAVEAT